MVDMYIYESTSLLEQLDQIMMKTESNNKFDDEDINEILTKEINRALKELSEFDAAKLAEIDAKNDEEE